VICRYYFDGTVSNQANVYAMLRSLVYQIIVARRKLLKIVKRAMEEHKQLFTDGGALWRLFQTLATHQQVRTLIIIVDAIDECPQENQEWFVRHLHELVNLNITSIRAFVTSRPNCPSVNALKNLGALVSHLRLETRQNNLDEDVNIFIQEHTTRLVRNGKCTEETRNALERVLQGKAEGSFLWVSLALSHLRHRRFLRKSDLLAVAKDLPGDLMRMYKYLIEAIPEDECSLASRTICFVATCQRNLTIHEMDTMLAIDVSHRSTADIGNDSIFSRVEEVESLLRGLIRTSDSRIALIHHTLKEYLAEGQIDGRPTWNYSLFGNTKSSHRLVAECCMRYLSLEDFQHDLFSDSMPSTPTTSGLSSFDMDSDHTSSGSDDSLGILFREPEEITADFAVSMGNRYKFFDYAARFWVFHFSEIQHESSAELQQLALDLYEATSHRNWFKYVSTLDHDLSGYPVDPDVLTLACFFGHVALVKTLLRSHDEGVCSPALYWAAIHGHAPCITTLLLERPLRKSWASVAGRSPLAVAAARGHAICVEEILSKRTFCVNEMDLNGRTPLSLAAGGSHLETVCKILSEENVDVNLADRSGATPMLWAVCANSLEVVQCLLKDKRTHSNCVDFEQRTALSWACEYGFADIVRLLARGRKAELNRADIRGRTPLMYAAMSGHLKVVKYMIHRGGVDLSPQDNEGRNVISWAAQQLDVRVLECLLENNPLGAQTKDAHGWSPFAWTMDPPERLANAIALLSHVPEACHENGSGLSMFALAVSWKSFGIAKLLISQEKFSVNESSLDGRTAISYAAEGGHVGLVRQLLAVESLDVNIADLHGMTPYSFAAAGHHDEVCRLLQQRL
jgi:ankyrin repeat protein